MKPLIAILIILTSMVMAFWGYSNVLEDAEHFKEYILVPYPVKEYIKTPPEIVIKEVVVEKEVVVFKEAIVEREVEKIVYTPIWTRDWESIDQFREW